MQRRLLPFPVTLMHGLLLPRAISAIFSESTSSTRVAVLYMTLNRAKSLLPVMEPVSIDANKAFIVSLDMTSGSFFTGRILFTDVILHPYFMNATFFLDKKAIKLRKAAKRRLQVDGEQPFASFIHASQFSIVSTRKQSPTRVSRLIPFTDSR